MKKLFPMKSYQKFRKYCTFTEACWRSVADINKKIFFEAIMMFLEVMYDEPYNQKAIHNQRDQFHKKIITKMIIKIYLSWKKLRYRLRIIYRHIQKRYWPAAGSACCFIIFFTFGKTWGRSSSEFPWEPIK